MSDLSDLLLILNRLQARTPPPVPGDFGGGVNGQLTLFNGTATATQISAVQANLAWRYGVFVLNITATSGTTPTLNVVVQGVSKSGVPWNVPSAAFPQQTGVAGPLLLLVGPGLLDNCPLPSQFQVVQTIGGTTPSFTYSLDVDLIL